jgi:iron complex transport system permease protein
MSRCAPESPPRGRSLRGRRLLVVGLGAAVLGVVVVASLALGSVDIEPARVLAAFTAFDGSSDHIIVRELRAPRTLVGFAVGAALGLAGALMQGLTRNPLAEPGLLGINAGASLGVVIAIALLGVTTPAGYLWFALAGAAAAATVVTVLAAAGRRGSAPVSLILAGAILAALLASVTSAILIADSSTLSAYRFWVVGSIADRPASVLLSAAPPMIAGGLIALAGARAMNALALGEDVARSLGIRVGLVRGAGMLAVVLLAGGAVAAAGPIVFVGLAVPHVARSMVGADWRWILALCLVVGPTLLLGADVVGRLAARPGEIQVGVVTALVGAPLFVAIVRRRNLARL